MSCVMFRWCTRAVEWNWAISRALWQRAWYWSYRALWQRAWYWSSRALWQRAWYWLSRTLWWKRWYVLLQLRWCDVTLWLWRSDTKPWMWYCDIVVELWLGYWAWYMTLVPWTKLCVSARWWAARTCVWILSVEELMFGREWTITHVELSWYWWIYETCGELWGVQITCGTVSE